MMLIQLVIYVHGDSISLLCFILFKINIRTFKLGCNSTASKWNLKEVIRNRMIVDT